MTINSAIMLELTRQRHLDVAQGVANARRPAPARHESTSNRRPAYRTGLALVTAVVVGTLLWAAFVTGLAAVTPTPAKAATGTVVAATAYQAETASVTRTRPTRTVTVTPHRHGVSTPHGHSISTPDHGGWA